MTSTTALNPMYDHLLSGRRIVASDSYFKCGQALSHRRNRRLRTEKRYIERVDIEEFLERELTKEQRALLDAQGFVDVRLDFRQREGLERLGHIRVSARYAGGSRRLLNMTARHIAGRIFTWPEFNLQSEYLRGPFMTPRRGIDLIASPMNMGKSSLLMMFLNELNRRFGLVITLFQEPIEQEIPDAQRGSIEQIEIPTDIPSLMNGLVAIKRTTTDVAGIGEARRPEEKESLIDLGRSMRVMATSFASDSASAIQDIIETVPPERRDAIRHGLAENLNTVIVLRQFPNARRMTEEEEETIRQAERQNVVFAAEVLVVTDAIRNLIRTADYSRIRMQMNGADRSAGSRILEAHIAELLKDGTVAMDDVRAEIPSRAMFETELRRVNYTGPV